MYGCTVTRPPEKDPGSIVVHHLFPLIVEVVYLLYKPQLPIAMRMSEKKREDSKKNECASK